MKSTLEVRLKEHLEKWRFADKGVRRDWIFNDSNANAKTMSCTVCGSFLSTSVCAASVFGAAQVKTCVNLLKPTIEKSDAMLYAPSTNEVEENCKDMSLRCYIWELIMVINEEEITHAAAGCIFEFNEKLTSPTSYDGCPPCEAYTLKNITIFIDRLTHLLEEMYILERKKVNT